MLDWCKNRQQDESRSEIYLPHSPTTVPPPHPQTQQPPKFTCPSQKQIRKLRPTPRHTNLPTKESSNRADKAIQASQEPIYRAAMVDSSTQTQKLGVQLLKSYRNGHSLVSSRQPSPKNNLKNSVYLKIEDSKHIQFPVATDRSFKQSIYFKPDYNTKTKATYCLADTKDRMEFCEKSKLQGLFGIQSYHLPQRGYQECAFPARHLQYNQSELYNQSVLYHQSQLYNQPTSNTCLAEQKPVESQNQLTFSSKYREMLRNVQNQFKQSQEKSAKHRSLRNIKCTPERPDRRLLYERQTILSKFTSSNARSTEKEILVEQSIIVQRQAISLFTILSKQEFFDYFSLCLARQNRLGLVVSIKELSITNMDHISQELLVYKQLQSSTDHLSGLLKLYQTQIDHNSYLFIKEPFTHTLAKYVEQQHHLTEVMEKIQIILQDMYRMGFYLRRQLRVQDFVEVYTEIKIQNAAVFILDRSYASVSIDEALFGLRAELLEFF